MNVNYFIKQLFITLLFGLSVFSCSSNDDLTDKIEIVELTVESETSTVVSMDNIESEWLVINEKNKSYNLPLKWIEGFIYEKGFEYHLRVKKVTPKNAIQDAPLSFYSLIEVLYQKKIEK